MEQRMRLERLRFELRMKLAAKKERMPWDLDDLDVRLVRSCTGEAKTRAGKDGLVLAVELIAMAMTLADLGGAVSLGGDRIGLQDARPCAETHGAAHLFNADEFAEFVDDAVRRGRVELTGVRLRQAADVARVLDAGGLHAEADTEVGHLLFARIADGVGHAFNAALAEAARDEGAV